MRAERPATQFTEDAVLGGRLRLRQPRKGHRVGHDAILLAAATEAGAGDYVVDFGAGVGAAGLALAVRVPGVSVALIDIDPELCALAAENARGNRLEDRVKIFTLDATDTAAFGKAGLKSGSAQRVLMNPPFNDPTNVSPDAGRRRAHVAAPETLARWTATAAHLLADGGVLTLIWRADGLGDVTTALEKNFGSLRVLPVHPRPDAAAIRVLVRAVKGGRAPPVTSPGLYLNDESGRPSAAAEAVLRAGESLRFAEK